MSTDEKELKRLERQKRKAEKQKEKDYDKALKKVNIKGKTERYNYNLLIQVVLSIPGKCHIEVETWFTVGCI